MRFVLYDHWSVSDFSDDGDGHRRLYISDDYGKALQQIELATVKYARENSSYGNYYLKVEA